MAVNIRKSVILSNRDATPPLANAPQTGGRTFSLRGKVLTVTSDSIASQIGFFSVKSSDVVTSATLYCDALSTSVAADIGLWETPVNGGFNTTTGWLTQAHANADSFGAATTNAKQFFGAAVVMSSALWASELLPVSSWETLAKFDQPIWQVMGLSSDPMRDYDVVATFTVAVVAGGWVGLQVAVKRP